MLRWAVAFFMIAVIAGIFGFGGIASGAVDIARICFIFFIIVFAVSLTWGVVTGRAPRGPLI
jgi:uncharacterized membrane protein YtjA (UPF0391 family)